VSHLSATHWTIIQAAQAGDAEAVRRLCEKYRPAVLGWLARRGVGPDVEDLGQDALVALVTSALGRADRGAGRFRDLVFAVARNVLLRHRERANAAKRGPGRTVPLADLEPPAEAPDDDFDQEWLAALVQGALARLAREHPPYFEAVRRFVLGDEPQAAIAAALGVTPGAVKKLVLRGKRKLAGYLREAVWEYATSTQDYEAELRALARLLGPLGVTASSDG
jgi:RNA polymerase sigma factor (sigma-70 family)